MKIIKLFENYHNDILEIINKIKKELSFDIFGLDDIEFKENFNNNLDKLWQEVVDEQEMGDCQYICRSIDQMNIENVKTHFGEINVDYNLNGKNKKFTHHWVTIYGKIYEFSKGTLKNNIDWVSLYDVDCEDDLIYNGIKNENNQFNIFENNGNCVLFAISSEKRFYMDKIYLTNLDDKKVPKFLKDFYGTTGRNTIVYYTRLGGDIEMEMEKITVNKTINLSEINGDLRKRLKEFLLTNKKELDLSKKF